MTTHIQAHMPPLAPLQMPVQDLRDSPKAQTTPTGARNTGWRLGVFGPAILGTLGLMWGLHGVFLQSGMSHLEWALLLLIGATFIWVILSIATVAAGIAGRLQHQSRVERADIEPLTVALVIPIHNEVPWEVFGNASAMLRDLSRQNSHHRYSVFVLSDSTDHAKADLEWQAFTRLHASATSDIPVYYRRRAKNTDKKVGNLVDWITQWGGAHDAMLVLDADSLMTGRAINRLADELGADPGAGLIQSFPQLIGAETLFARVQQFSNMAYGWLLAEGLAKWAQTEGNYWGHNAIIRTRAFAAAAGLPYLNDRLGRDELILSHDFVEASLLRRAGWRVRFLPRVTGSFEETPGTLIDYVIRDRRWCRGNLQHLRLLGTKGLHPISRFHMFQGAVAYLMSPAWFILLVFWTLLGRDADSNVITYFHEANPLFPTWPPEMTHLDSAIFLVLMYLMLLTPKLAGAGIIAANHKAARVFGGRAAFLGALVTEVALSILYAPILMIQQTHAIVLALRGRSKGWTPQRRDAQAYPLRTLIKFHWMETLLGIVLTTGLFAGLVSLWLLPIAFSLTLAIPLSALSALRVSYRAPAALRMESPNSLREPAIFTYAKRERSSLQSYLTKMPVE